jgi:hypothetical protein
MRAETVSQEQLVEMLRAGICPMCETPVAEKEPGEGVTNGMHNYCCLQNTTGHLVGACRCHKKLDDLTDRELAIEAARRFQDWDRAEKGYSRSELRRRERS